MAVQMAAPTASPIAETMAQKAATRKASRWGMTPEMNASRAAHDPMKMSQKAA
jgi:hypothetical protein